jgi:hypothetical protein
LGIDNMDNNAILELIYQFYHQGGESVMNFE